MATAASSSSALELAREELALAADLARARPAMGSNIIVMPAVYFVWRIPHKAHGTA